MKRTVPDNVRSAASAILLLALSATALADGPLDACAGQFVDGDIGNAPTVLGSRPELAYRSNVHLCYRTAETSFFAMEYWREQFAPRWVAYKLSPENYGSDGCATYTRKKGNCYIRGETWEDVLACGSSISGDPFHTDHLLPRPKLGTGDFDNTGHDRGHLAPRQAFSWHVCGAYQTFTMANMSPQRAFLNQDIWAALEQQVLTWAFDDGPLYVVTGAMYRSFPYQRFKVYRDGVLDPAQIYRPGGTMQEAVERHHENFGATNTGDILHPKRDAKPDRVRDQVRDMKMPTGYFKVIYRPAMDGEPAHAIGFLLPHSFENLNMLTGSYPRMPTAKAFWAFAARIDLVEQASGITFPGIPADLKHGWGDGWFFDRMESRNISEGCADGMPQGVIENSTRAERLATCISALQ